MSRIADDGFPPGPKLIGEIKNSLSAFHRLSTDEVAQRLGRTSPRQVREVERALRFLRGRCEVRQDEDGWRIC